ncbi:hypothetical protein [Angelakisella massiliensis]|uniref:hypothetical protein n=1 Tax=Angelakisella massiliensis TaxID=1871018 RepID=UPI0024B27CD3|nr:hypothetical protein [Angelakisella massiliensis]
MKLRGHLLLPLKVNSSNDQLPSKLLPFWITSAKKSIAVVGSVQQANMNTSGFSANHFHRTILLLFNLPDCIICGFPC